MAILKQSEPTLPASYYYDAAHHQREIARIWYREWLCVGRVDEIAERGDFRLHAIGDQRIFVTRDAQDTLHAFHNTCRHRGSALCSTPAGRFRQRRIVCPYHAWTYSLSGELIATPRRLPAQDFDRRDYGLYRVPVECWGGFVFVKLDASDAAPLEQRSGSEMAAVNSWPLADLALAHRETHTLSCNWKIFWENFSECYHCPLVHPQLCRLVPTYAHAVVSPEDDPRAEDGTGAQAGLRAALAPGAVTWSMDGQTTLQPLRGLGAQEREAGMTFAVFLPGMFVIAHVDYVRTVRVLPLGPEQTQLVVDWLLAPEALRQPGFDLEQLVELGRLVVMQDARVCEINQQGLRSRAHSSGVLVPQEQGVYEFDRWVLEQLAED